jgi:hypothetical protein
MGRVLVGQMVRSGVTGQMRGGVGCDGPGMVGQMVSSGVMGQMREGSDAMGRVWWVRW